MRTRIYRGSTKPGHALKAVSVSARGPSDVQQTRDRRPASYALTCRLGRGLRIFTFSYAFYYGLFYIDLTTEFASRSSADRQGGLTQLFQKQPMHQQDLLRFACFFDRLTPLLDLIRLIQFTRIRRGNSIRTWRSFNCYPIIDSLGPLLSLRSFPLFLS